MALPVEDDMRLRFFVCVDAGVLSVMFTGVVMEGLRVFVLRRRKDVIGG